jgi:hypothetical protein
LGLAGENLRIGGQQGGQPRERMRDGNGVLALAPPGDLAVTGPKHAGERGRRAASGSWLP